MKVHLFRRTFHPLHECSKWKQSERKGRMSADRRMVERERDRILICMSMEGFIS